MSRSAKLHRLRSVSSLRPLSCDTKLHQHTKFRTPIATDGLDDLVGMGSAASIRLGVLEWRPRKNTFQRTLKNTLSMTASIPDPGDVDFDGGETGCGELLLDLLLFMKRQPDNATVTVRALDPGAPLEIPAWCRLTQHELLSAKHPIYTIRKP
jgi:tRNA 2-thiouridine synthesizing protein A